MQEVALHQALVVLLLLILVDVRLIHGAPTTGRGPPTIDQIVKEAAAALSDRAEYPAGNRNCRLTELDMCLTEEQREAIHGTSQSHKVSRIAIGDEAYRWTGAIIPYEIDGAFDQTDRDRIRRAMDEWESYTCLQFVPRSNQANYVRIISDSGCWSEVGMTGNGMQHMSLQRGSCLQHHTIIHELGHTIGFHHVQTRPDRDNYVRILEDNIAPHQRYNFEKYKVGFLRNYGIKYDYWSVMHYSQYAFSRNGQETIITVDPDYQGVIGTVPRSSLKDIQTANLMYRCSATDPFPYKKTDTCVHRLRDELSQISHNGASDFFDIDNVPENVRSCTVGTSTCGTVDVCLPCKIMFTASEQCTCRRHGKAQMSQCDRRKCPQNAILSEDCKCWCNTGNPGNPVVEWDGTSECRGPDMDRGTCLDYEEECARWASEGQCETNTNYMLMNCRLSCKVCGPEAVCRDFNDRCEYWALTGECRINPGWMLANCMKSCQVCGSTEQPDPNDCVDSSALCPAGAARGDCEEFADSMLERCRKSCKTCKNSPANFVCRNWHIECPIWKDIGRCSSDRDFMDLHCPRACGKCTGGTVPDCKNYVNDTDCERWRKEGECANNPGWMLFNCALSCRTCGNNRICQDRHPDCKDWEDRGYCTDEEERVAMHFYCPVSCGHCQGDSSNSGTCQNYEPSCSTFESQGWCDSNPNLMLRFCPKSCRICGPNPVCKNYNDMCDEWQRDGECSANPRWMHVHCARSCNTCPQPDNSGNGGNGDGDGNGGNGDGDGNDGNGDGDGNGGNGDGDGNGGNGDSDGNGGNGDNDGNGDGGDNDGNGDGNGDGGNDGGGDGDDDGDTGNEDCSDREDTVYCMGLASAGYCTSQRGWMLYHCAKSCQNCGPNAECSDYNSNCIAWATAGECARNPGYMHLNCRRACSLCNPGDGDGSGDMGGTTRIPTTTRITTTRRTTTTTAPSSACNYLTPEWCRNFLTDCDRLARFGECDSNPDVMLVNCPISCGICGANQRCKDRNQHCAAWAAGGHCERSPYYMQVYCRTSCRCCG